FKYQPCEKIRSYHPYPTPNEKLINEAAEIINAAEKPYILAGHGVLISGAEEALKEISEKADIPVGLTLLGLSCFPPDHKNYVGFLGMHGNYGPNIKTNECDVLIAIGMRFDDRVTGDIKKYARQAKVIHIEIDPSEINKNVKATVAINSDARQTLSILLPLIRKNTHAEWISEFRDCDKIEYEKVIRNQIHSPGEKLRMGEVVKVLSDKTNGEAVIVTDVGQHQMIASRYYEFKVPNYNITSGGLGTMGFALPAAMGAQLGLPNHPVVAIIGDGGFQMTIQELGTISQSKIPVKIIVLNNHFLGMVRQWQQLFFDKRYSFTEMKNPDFVKICEGYGISSRKLVKKDKLSQDLDWLLKTTGPVFLEVEVEKEDNVFPMVPSGDSVSNIRLE
ncbi:MAG TPA: thiamine pyrophosphate-dependent enzyme, partial [Cyclobacteriaceae bacterium]|nr:thiamine pyrophosphate-dependent enzyme [Cyclobacteriaceae bacterium]